MWAARAGAAKPGPPCSDRPGSTRLVRLPLVQPHFPEIAQRDGEALKGIALADVLLDAVPLNTRIPAGLEDGGPVEVALAHLRHQLLAPFHRHVFQVHDGNAALSLANP